MFSKNAFVSFKSFSTRRNSRNLTKIWIDKSLSSTTWFRCAFVKNDVFEDFVNREKIRLRETRRMMTRLILITNRHARISTFRSKIVFHFNVDLFNVFIVLMISRYLCFKRQHVFDNKHLLQRHFDQHHRFVFDQKLLVFLQRMCATYAQKSHAFQESRDDDLWNLYVSKMLDENSTCFASFMNISIFEHKRSFSEILSWKIRHEFRTQTSLSLKSRIVSCIHLMSVSLKLRWNMKFVAMTKL